MIDCMFKLPIPFSIGKFSDPDPFTFEYEIDHPILNVSSSYSSVKDEVVEWLNVTLDERWKREWSTGGWAIYFESEEDMTLFLLRWL